MSRDAYDEAPIARVDAMQLDDELVGDEIVAPRQPADRRFAIQVALIAGFGFLVRIAYLYAFRNGTINGDGRYYHVIAGLIADGKGFITPSDFLQSGSSVPSAAHPPLWPLTLALLARFGLRTILEQQLLAAVVGSATIAVVGCAGRRIGGVRAGLIAASLAAITPTFIIYEWELMSEALALLGVAVLMLLTLRFQDQPSLPRALAVGFSVGLLALTRSEQVVLIAALLAPLLLLARGITRRRRWIWLIASVLVVAATIAPWTIYNTARFKDPVLLSTQLGQTMVEANCDSSYFGTRLGLGDPACRVASPNNDPGPGGDASTRDSAMRHEAIDYMKEHKGRVPVVIAAREGRAWGIFRPFQDMRFDTFRGTPLRVIQLGFLAYWALAVAAIAGFVILWRRKVSLLAFIAVFVTVAIGVAISFGSSRYRAPADVPIVLLAAVALDVGLRRLEQGARTTPASGVDAPVTTAT